jgi:hypothetical protein
MGNSKNIRRRRRLKKLRRGFLIVAGVALVAWIFYLGATWGPGPADAAAARQNTTVVNDQLVEESKRLAREFEAIAARGEPTEADLDLLRQAIAKQREFNLAQRPSPQDRQRQEELEQRLNHFGAKTVFLKSEEAEKEADRLLEAGEVSEAVRQIQLALELQREVNQRFGRSEFRSTPRETRLAQRFASMEAQPLHDRSVELEKLAAVAIEAHRWEEARRHLTEARELQVRINEGSRRSAFFDTGRQERLTTRLASLRVGETMSEVQGLEEQALAQENNGQFERAAQLYERAMILQNQINRDHPQSPFASSERASDLDAARQTALSTPQARELREAVAAMRQALAEENNEVARRQIQEGNRLVRQLFDRYPRSRHLDFDTRLELEYLSLIERNLPELQTLLREDLRRLPGQQEWQMSSTPVSQRLYSRVMNGNPSRNVGLDLPVDSVTLSQAREFCRRASWILARPVQLPERQHVEAAIGDWKPEAYAEASWHRGNSGGNSHPVTSGSANAHGFFHLVGNLRQWLHEEAEGGNAWTAGLSYEDEFPRDDLFQQIRRTERSRTVGFRYVVGERSVAVSRL